MELPLTTKAVRIMTAVLVAAATLFAGCIDNNEELYAESQKLWLEENYDQAVSKLLVLLEKEKESPLAAKALFRLGEIHYLNLDETEKAVDYFSKSARITNDRKEGLDANDYIAEIYLDGPKDYDLAILQYQRVLDEYPDIIDKAAYKYKIAKTYFAKGAYAQAVVEFQDLLDKFPDSSLAIDAGYHIANCHFITGNAKMALSKFNALLLIENNQEREYDIRLGAALCYEELDKLKEALKSYKEMSGIFPEKELILRKIASVKKRIRKKKVK